MTKFGTYTGEEFIKLDLPPREWLVENLLRVNDSVILVGNEKSGKSLFIMQLICSLTTCHPFIDRYNVPLPRRVTYVQLEGELSDSQDRMKRMIKTLDIDLVKFQLMFYPPLDLHDNSYAKGFIEVIERSWNPETKEIKIKPDVVIIDPIYFAYAGSLSDDEMVRKFVGNVRILKDRLNCAVILVHHTHKQRWSYMGDKMEEGDEAIFGSKLFKAWADHLLLFTYDNKRNVRILACDTQRSGDIIKKCELKLIEPAPLYFAEANQQPTKEFMIAELLRTFDTNHHGMTAEQIMIQLKLGRTTFYNSIKQLLATNIIVKVEGTRPLQYKITAQGL